MVRHTRSGLTAGAILVMLSALGFSTNPIFGKLAYDAGGNAITVGAARFLFATLGLWLYLIGRRSAGGIALGKRVKLFALGVGGMAAVSLLYFSALPHIDAGLATGIFYLHPAMIALVGLVRGERLGRMGLAGLILTGVGTWLLIGTGPSGFTLRGLLMILAAAALYSAYMIIGERWTAGVSPVVTSAHVTLSAAAVYIILGFLTHQQLPALQVAAAGAGLALCSTILALVTFFGGLPLVGPTRAAVISTLEPVFTVILAALLLGERLSPVQVGGVLVVALGAVAVQLRTQSAVGAQA